MLDSTPKAGNVPIAYNPGPTDPDEVFGDLKEDSAFKAISATQETKCSHQAGTVP